MAKLTLLGTGAALSDANRENMYLVVEGAHSAILVDCAGSPVQRLLHARVPLDSIDHVILTHHHPDHLYGLPIFLMDLWLHKRKQALHIYGLPETIRSARALLDAFDWHEWHKHGFFPTEFHTLEIPASGIGAAFETADFKITATRTKHFVPTIALRFDSKGKGKTLVYSSDTEPCEAVAELATGAHTLLHEATEISKTVEGHSSALQAGMQATRAGVKRLVLVHLSPDGSLAKLCKAAQKTFKGQVVVGKDFLRIKF
jgi:ribonuclease Z